MKQWYCYVGGKQHGPLSEAVLRSWIQQGRLGRSDLVWTAGMADWTAASEVPGLFAQPGEAEGGSMVLAAPLPGSGGCAPNRELTARARASLRGQWGPAIGLCLLLLLANMLASYLPMGSLVLSGPLSLGAVIFFLTIVRGGQARIKMLFSGFKNFGNALVAYLVMTIFVFLWLLLFIIPGIVAALAYAQTFYLLADDPSLDGLDAIRLSKRMMRGYKWKLFCLWLRFFGWALLCVLTFGIGLLWLWPYMAVSYAHFYEDLKQAGGQQQQTQPPGQSLPSPEG